MNNIVNELKELKYYSLEDIDKIMNNANVDFDYYDYKREYGFVSPEEADEMIKYECNASSMDRMACFLAGVKLINQDYYFLNGYGNLENVGFDTLECFKSDLIRKLKEAENE